MQARDKAIRFQIHALRRMRRRGVDERQVERAIRTGKKSKTERPNSLKFTLKVSKKTTIVVIAEENDKEFWAVTAWRK